MSFIYFVGIAMIIFVALNGWMIKCDIKVVTEATKTRSKAQLDRMTFIGSTKEISYKYILLSAFFLFIVVIDYKYGEGDLLAGQNFFYTIILGAVYSITNSVWLVRSKLHLNDYIAYNKLLLKLALVDLTAITIYLIALLLGIAL